MTTTPLMNLLLPDPGVTVGPLWAQELNDAFEVLDGHNHLPGSGALVPVDALSINKDLPLAGFNLTNARAVRVNKQTGTLVTSADKNQVYSVNGDMYWNNDSGVPIRLTNGTGINISGVAGFYGDYAQPGVPAAATYSNTTKTFTFTQNTGITAIINAATYQLSQPTSGAQSVSLKAAASTTAYDFIFPATGAGVASRLEIATSGQVSFVNRLVGQVPLGGVVPTFPNLTGAYVTAATTVADAAGFVLCNGQVLADGTSPMNGDTIPNLNNASFLMGDVPAQSGVGGGSNTALLFHAHIMDHGHANTIATTAVNVPHNHGGLTVAPTSNLIHNHGVTDPGHTHPFQAFTVGGGANIGPEGIINGTGIYGLTTDSRVTGLTVNNSADLTHNHTLAVDNINHNHPITGGVTNFAGSTGNAGSGGDSRPKFASCVYIMRVK